MGSIVKHLAHNSGFFIASKLLTFLKNFSQLTAQAC